MVCLFIDTFITDGYIKSNGWVINEMEKIRKKAFVM